MRIMVNERLVHLLREKYLNTFGKNTRAVRRVPLLLFAARYAGVCILSSYLGYSAAGIRYTAVRGMPVRRKMKKNESKIQILRHRIY